MGETSSSVLPSAPIADYAWSHPGGLVERPGEHPGEPELWVYCDRFSYDIGERVSIKIQCTEPTLDLEIIRDGYTATTVQTVTLQGTKQDTPADAYATGCNWKESHSIILTDGWQPGYYLIIVRIRSAAGRVIEREGFFVVKNMQRKSDTLRTADFVLIHTTSTILAYNDWGGANHYRGLADGYQNDIPTPVVSTQRPIARGMLRLPPHAPREGLSDAAVPYTWTPRHPAIEWAYYFGYSRHYADAGYATYERPFLVWAERNGYKVDHLTQHDLHFEPDCLNGYRMVVIVGHDEYWTWEMRDTIDAFVDRGGKLARFGGNYCWQVRFDDKGLTQTCYKVPQDDPLYGTNDERVTTLWDWTKIGRAGAKTMGLTGLAGVYTRYGSATPRWCGGFTVYRPHHWALEGTQLFYGDVLGAGVGIAGFEVDGVEYTFRKGLPYPTGEDGAPNNLEIIAMCPAVKGERDVWNGQEPIGGPLREMKLILDAMYPGDTAPEYLKDAEYGSGMIASFSRNKGEVFCAGTTDWVVGLMKHDPFVEKITANVLNKFCGRWTDGSGRAKN